MRGNIANAGSVDTAVAAAASTMGGIGIVINNAGIGAQETVVDNDDEEWLRGTEHQCGGHGQGLQGRRCRSCANRVRQRS